jgi:hypothetical protein
VTKDEFIALVEAKVIDNDTGLITPATVREVLAALAKVIDEGGFE